MTLQGIVIDAFNSTVVSGGLDGQVLKPLQALLFDLYLLVLLPACPITVSRLHCHRINCIFSGLIQQPAA
jgi:hypothetical protein